MSSGGLYMSISNGKGDKRMLWLGSATGMWLSRTLSFPT